MRSHRQRAAGRRARWGPVLGLALALTAGACTAAPTATTTSTTTGAGPGVAVGPDVVVSYVQSALSALGYLDEVNGVFDSATAAALRTFQSSRHLPDNGQLDAATALALAQASPETKRYAVSALQTQLTELGYFRGLIDGTWGPRTQAAVEALQRDSGLTVDGAVGPATLQALDRLYRRRVVEPEQAAERYFPPTTATGAGPSPTTSGAGTAPTTTTTVAPAAPSPTSAQISEVQRRLVALGYRPGPVTGRPDVQTASAVLAFQKREGLQRDGTIGPQVLGRIGDPRGAGPRSDAPGPRVEVDLDRQIVFFIDAQGQVTTLNASTGSGATYREPGGGTAVAYTPTGHFTIQRKINGNEIAPLGSLYRPAYFKGGWAIHGSPSVPAYPASHGCVRVANWDQDFLYPLLPVGTPVWIYGTSLGNPEKGAPGF